ncbi:MAG: FAD:protein FMN transferase [Chloroflexi bacterium]|nr:FAD:protein FMN transferase [Chloroflexota bacterium]
MTSSTLPPEAPVSADAARSYQAVGTSMGTVVSLEVITARPAAEARGAMDRALRWFAAVERTCSRFDPAGEVQRPRLAAGRPVAVSPILFEATRFATALASQTGGAFDPTVGHLLEARGFNRQYATGQAIRSSIPASDRPTYRDVQLDATRQTIALRRPLVLDLGAVAKGLAIDLAARELSAFGDYCIDAGGDIFAQGRNSLGEPWQIGVRNPRETDAVVRVLSISGQAVCTSGDYERRTADDREHHLVDPRSGRSAGTLASVTVVASTALAADGLATAAFILGPARGLRLLEREGAGGLRIAPDGAIRTTRGLGRASGLPLQSRDEQGQGRAL